MARARRRLIAALGFLGLLTIVSPVFAQSGPVAAYGFNEGAGGSTADATGNGNTGTITGATWTASGRFGGALTFNGTSNWVTVPDVAALDLTSAMTVEAWVYATSTASWRSVVLKEASGGLSYALYGTNESSRPAGYIRRTSDVAVNGTSSLATNGWVHLAVTYNGSALVLFVNGTQTSSTATTGSIATSASPLRIGGNAVWGEYFTGRIDEVRIYNRALTAAQIQTDMATAVGGAAPTPDFSVSATPATRSIAQGSSTTYSVTVGSLNGFASAVTLSATGLPSGASASFSPASVTGSGTSTMTVTTTGATPVSTSTVTITGTSGATTHSSTVSLAVTQAPVADFTVTPTPSSRSIAQGSSTTYSVAIGSINGFSGTVTLSATGLPSGAGASFSPASVTGSGTSTMTVTTTGATPVSTSTVTITGTSGAVNHSSTVSLAVTQAPVADFTLTPTPSSRSIVRGAGTTYTIAVAAVNGFSGTVTLGVTGGPANTTIGLSPQSVAGSGSSTLTVTTTGTTPTGTSTLTITGTSGSLSHSTTVSLTVTPPPDFTLGLSPGSQSVAQGSSASYTVTVGATNGFSGSVALGASGLPANASAGFSPASITTSGTSTLTITTTGTTPIGTVTFTVTGTSGALSHSASADVSVTTAPSGSTGTISVNFVGNGASMAASESAGVVAAANWNNATGASSTSPLALRNQAAAVTGATLAWTSNNTWLLPVTDQAGSRRMMRGYLDTTTTSVSTLTVAGLPVAGYDVYLYADGDNGSEARTASYAISGSGVTPATVTLTDATSTNFNATFTRAQNGTGNYVRFSINAGGFTITATPGTSTGTRRAPVNGLQIVPTTPPAPDFSVSATPGSASVIQGNPASYSVTVNALNGFTSDVTLSTSGLPSGATATFTPPTTSGGGSSTLEIATTGATATGTKTVTIIGTDGTATRQTTVSLTVSPPPQPDFTVAITPATRTVTQGGTASYSVTIASLNGFAGAVSLGLSGHPAQSSPSFTPASVNGAGSSTLDIDTSSSTTTGTVTVTVTATSGALSHTATASLTVSPLTYAISGTITPASGGASAAIGVGGTATGSGTADAQGAYSVGGLPNGSYVVTPTKGGFTFTPASRNVMINGGAVTGIDFAANQSPITVAISSPANNANVSSTFSITATGTGPVAGVQFKVDGIATGAEDTVAPYSTSVTATAGSHTLTAVGRDTGGGTVTSAPVTVNVGSGGGSSMSINGAQTFQTVDGFGVNLNSLSWKNGELIPALDKLVDDLGAKTWRVVFDMEDWEATNDNADPNVPDWTYYNALYSNAKFQNLWGTLHYLNSKGVTSGIMLSFMGRVPPWMGGASITTSLEDEWVEMIATLIYYARNTENVQFDLVDPLNEPDWDGIEGPHVSEFQYPRLLQKLSQRLDAMNLSTLRFVGPNTALLDAGDDYMVEMLANATVMSKLDHFGLHSYEGTTGNADNRIKNSAYPSRNFWMTEFSNPEQLFALISQGAAATQVWDAYDSVYNHAILAGRGSSPPNDAGNLAALMSYSTQSGTYAKRPQFQQAQAFKYVSPGSVRIGVTANGSTVLAFRHAGTGRVTIVGRNTGSAITYNGTLNNAGTVSSFEFYSTSGTFSSFVRGADVVVTNGSFVVTIPSNSFFTLTSGGQ